MSLAAPSLLLASCLQPNFGTHRHGGSTKNETPDRTIRLPDPAKQGAHGVLAMGTDPDITPLIFS